MGSPELMEMDLRHAVPAHPRARPRGRRRARPRDAAGRRDRAGGGAPGRSARRWSGRRSHPDARTPRRAAREMLAFARDALAPVPPTRVRQKGGEEGAAVTRTLAEVAAEAPAARSAGSRTAAPRSCSAWATRTPSCCSSAKGPGSTRTSRGSRSSARRGSCSRACSREIGLAREQVYIANVVKCRPPGQPRSAARRDRGMHAVVGRADLADPARLIVTSGTSRRSTCCRPQRRHHAHARPGL